MKKLMILLVCSLLLGCKVTKPVVVKTKEIKGKWLIESITDSNALKLSNDTVLLDDVAVSCFYDSIWKFDAVTNSGEYNINDLYCTFGKRKFSYESQLTTKEDGSFDFGIKPTERKKRKVKSPSFPFKLVNLSEATMQWQHAIEVDSKLTVININFKKLQKKPLTVL